MKVLSYPFKSIDQETWETLENRAHHLGVFQTYAWAETLRYTGIDPRFLLVVDQGESLAGLLIFQSNFVFSLFNAYEAKDAMLLTDINPDVVSSVVSHISSSLRSMLDPLTLYVVIYSAPVLSKLLRDHFEHENFHTQTDATFLIDLRSPVEILWRRLSKTARRLVRKTERQGVTISEAKDWSAWLRFYQLYFDDCQRLQLRPRSLLLHKGIYDFLLPKDMAKLFLAIYKGKIIAGRLLLLTPHQIVGYEITYDPRYQMLNPTYALYWRSISWAKERGIRYFDLGGTISRPTKDSSLYGVHKFKEKWGGNFVEFDFFNLRRFFLLGENLVYRSESFRKLYNLFEKVNVIRRYSRL
ncbi:MAG: lipid II:glycine glycyltransferase FemX [Promethearchaeota archaeon]